MTDWMRRLRGTSPRGDQEATDGVRLAIGRQESRYVRAQTFPSIRQAEFQVFSQWGEDGIIQYLLSKVPIAQPIFVELGVQDYSESNTRFLLCHDNWRGLIVDAGGSHQKFLRGQGLDWRYDVTAVSSFVTVENVDSILKNARIQGEIGLLSIDIDGNDYWVLKALTAVSPRILIVEYNSVFGWELPVAVPYRADFERGKAHFSNLYYGASIAALIGLARTRGYVCVGGNSTGNNVFFVRSDVLGSLAEISPRDAWAESRFRESRGPDGRLTLLGSHAARLAQIGNLPVLDLAAGTQHAIRDLPLHA